MTCTFFEHHDTPSTIKPLLRQVIIELIEQRGVTRFYVGNQGNFDAMAHSLLAELIQTYQIHYNVVLTYLPKKKIHPWTDHLRCYQMALRRCRRASPSTTATAGCLTAAISL